jgi:hypothetical protein
MNTSKHKLFASFAGALVTIALLTISCGVGNPTTTPVVEPLAETPKPGSAGAQAAQQAVEALAAQLNLDVLDVTVRSVAAVEWLDSCLGIHLPGQMCAMQVVDGYSVELQAQGYSYEYRTNSDGSVALPSLALTWHREGGVAGFCDDLVIDQTGEATAMSCKSGSPQGMGRATLKTEQTRQLQTWLASLSPFEVNQTDKATADTMAVRLTFDGRGRALASDTDKQAIELFAAEVYAQIRQGQATFSCGPWQCSSWASVSPRSQCVSARAASTPTISSS